MEEVYDPKKIESKWEQYWQERQVYKTQDSLNKKKYYCLDFFPYPSGASLSVGHCRNYIPTDVISRLQRMRGYNVLHPMGWDAFGLPAENFAIKTGKSPKVSTKENIKNFKDQLSLLGLSYDWSREINSTDPTYYRWTQWLFLLLYKKGLAYQKVADQWWCPSCKTVLANEQVEAGRCWRCNSEVTKKPLKQWFFKITSYADRLLSDLDNIDWPVKIKLMQRNWIGRKEGIVIDYHVEGREDQVISCFTTRPDTNFGATFVVIAPEHPLVLQITTAENQGKVKEYIEQSKKKTEIERIAEGRKKTGVFTGSYVINKLNNKKLPVWISDFVLSSVGTGAVVGVPGHDLRDFEFAQTMGLPVVRVVVGKDGDTSEITEASQVQEEEGKMINSDFLNDLDIHTATHKIMDYMEDHKWGNKTVTYKMRDWLISRQRYWGAPIPIIHCEKCGTVPVPEKDLPVLLPDITNFEPTGTGESPLSRSDEFVNTTCPHCGGKAKRETDTQDGFACSSWYYLRYADPHNAIKPFEKEKSDYWLPVDLYVGGAEHAVMHLLYARFYTKVMNDEGLIDFKEPFLKLKNQGMILATDGRKMSKSYGNVITPNSVVDKYGADALRLYELFLGPFEQEIAWDDSGVKGTRKFLEKIWNYCFQEELYTINNVSEADALVERELHKTIKKVEKDLLNFKFNTAVSSLMEFVNLITEKKISTAFYKKVREALILVLAPMTPYITEEIWHKIFQNNNSVHSQKWPEFEESLTIDEFVEIPIQINGKIRDRIVVKRGLVEDDLRKMVLENQKIQNYIKEKNVRKFIYIKDRIINIIV